jgi:hypothetical protein
MTTLLTTAIVIGMLESAECSGRCAGIAGILQMPVLIVV